MNILFYGPLGNNIPKERIGGAETGCKRSIETLKDNNFNIEIVEKPTNYYGIIKFFKNFFGATSKIKTILKNKNIDVFYLVGFYERQLIFEYYLTHIAKKNNVKIIYEPKNGTLVKKYKNGSKIYKVISNRIFRESSIIFCQGREYKEFLEGLGYTNAIYHPNYVSNKNLSLVRNERNDTIVFVYFGRITESKNVLFSVEVFKLFLEYNPNSKLYIIGGGKEEYTKAIKDLITKYQIDDQVELTGRLNFEDMTFYLNKAHFYLFPSSEEFEGHSNSLTEAMAYGIVPIASYAGFNNSVVGDKDLLVHDMDPQQYVKIAKTIIDSNLWTEISNKMKARVKELFSEDVVTKQYVESIQEIAMKADNNDD